MRRIGDTFDAITACCGAAVGAVALALPITYAWSGESTSYRLAALYNSVPRGAAIGVIVAATVAVLVTTFTRPATAWAVALAGSLGLFVNHLASRHTAAPEVLTTQDYVDAICGGILLGALGAAALRRPLPSFGFALGSVGFFVFGDLAEFLDIQAMDPYAVMETPPTWLISVAVVLVLLSAMGNGVRRGQVHDPDERVELPITPILAALVFALPVLVGTEWLSRQYDRAGGHTIDIALAVIATVIAATVAAMLLPRRDGVAILLAAAIAPAADALGPTPRPDWMLAAILVATGLGIVAGFKAPVPGFGLFMVGALSIFAIVVAPYDNTAMYATGSIALAFIAGYCCGCVRPCYVPSGVLAISALLLPSIVAAMPEEGDLPVRDAMAGVGTAGKTALAITIGCGLALAGLYRLRPPSLPRPLAPAPTGAVADI
ncbi:hypothetical protein OG225_31525 [Nocardia sp. NBC_01377]|uniref:hypothetical protein n=1 Tax=Nocardia sp. NBC_01377 TaxID=2903595 RepID=UPI003246622C